MSFDHIFDELSATAKSVEAQPVRMPTVEAEGACSDDLIVLTMRSGEFTDARVDPRAMRKSNADLGDLIIEAAMGMTDADGAAQHVIHVNEGSAVEALLGA